MSDWADKMAKKFGDDVHVYGTEELHELAGSVGPEDAAAFFREHCIPISRVREWLEAIEATALASSGVMAEAAVVHRLREILGQ